MLQLCLPGSAITSVIRAIITVRAAVHTGNYLTARQPSRLFFLAPRTKRAFATSVNIAPCTFHTVLTRDVFATCHAGEDEAASVAEVLLTARTKFIGIFPAVLAGAVVVITENLQAFVAGGSLDSIAVAIFMNAWRCEKECVKWWTHEVSGKI